MPHRPRLRLRKPRAANAVCMSCPVLWAARERQRSRVRAPYHAQRAIGNKAQLSLAIVSGSRAASIAAGSGLASSSSGGRRDAAIDNVGIATGLDAHCPARAARAGAGLPRRTSTEDFQGPPDAVDAARAKDSPKLMLLSYTISRLRRWRPSPGRPRSRAPQTPCGPGSSTRRRPRRACPRGPARRSARSRRAPATWLEFRPPLFD